MKKLIPFLLQLQLQDSQNFTKDLSFFHLHYAYSTVEKGRFSSWSWNLTRAKTLELQ